MVPLEEKAMDIVNELLENKKIPMDRVKSIKLNWEVIEGNFFPVLHCEFHRKDDRAWMTDFMKS